MSGRASARPSRARRRALKAKAAELAERFAAGGFFETLPDRAGLARVESRAAIEALTKATRFCFSKGGEPLIAPLSDEIARGFP